MKYIYLSVLALTSSASLAALSSFNGFYAGAQAGYSHTHIKRDLSVATPGISSWHHHHRSRSGNVDLGLFLGLGTTLGVSSFYVGGEAGLGYDRSHNKKNFYHNTIRSELKPSMKYNFSGRLGYIFCTKNFFYGRVGYQGYTQKARLHFTTPHRTYRLTRNGVMFGGGYEYALTDQTLLRLEYQFHRGLHKRHKHTTGITKVRASHHVHTHSALGGISYKF